MFEGLDFGIRTAVRLCDRVIAKAVIARLLGMPEHLRPRRYGRLEPTKGRIADVETTVLVDAWMEPIGGPGAELEREGCLLLDVSKGGGYDIRWAVEPKRLNSVGGFFEANTLKYIYQDVGLLLELLVSLVPIIGGIYGSMRLMDDLYTIPTDLTVRLPNVPWLSIYGPPYVEMFGEDRILAAPFWKVWKLESGHVIAQLTEHIDDEYGEPERKAVRDFLGADAFLEGKNRPRHHKTGRVPKIFGS